MILEETDACKVDQNEHNIILFFFLYSVSPWSLF